MPATFNLELSPGQYVALDTTVSSDELDMARMEDGTTVDGMFWGKLMTVHEGDTHTMDFSGTRLLGEDVTPDLMVDQRVITKLAVAAKPSVAKCRLSLLTPSMQYCDVVLSCSPMWKMGITWPPAEELGDDKFKYFLRVHPGGGFEHFESEIVSTAIYYEVMYDNLLFISSRSVQLANHDFQAGTFSPRSKRICSPKKQFCYVLPRFHAPSYECIGPTGHVRPRSDRFYKVGVTIAHSCEANCMLLVHISMNSPSIKTSRIGFFLLAKLRLPLI